jgi:putative ABC transport system ATP-binding protein
MIRCEQLRFAYPGDAFELRIDAFAVSAGEAVALVGPSGCGKTTLMNLISALLVPLSGSVVVDGVEVHRFPLAARQQFRLGKIGLVPQNFELLDYLTIRENILLPFRLGAGSGIDDSARARCDELATKSGIVAHLGKYPDQLSQGERQRAALCRGLVTAAPLILADEPTGNLDPENQDRIVSLLLDEARGIGATVLMITHDPVLLPRFDRVVDVLALRKGGAA